VNLQPLHLVGESVNVIWVTSQGPCDERIQISDVCNATTRGQTGHKANNF